MHALNAGLVAAFPTALRKHVLAALETFPEPEHPAAREFPVKIHDELVTIPYRLYHSPSQIKTEHITAPEREIVDCLLTRHHDGFVRQQHLERIIRSDVGTAHLWLLGRFQNTRPNLRGQRFIRSDEAETAKER